MHTDMQVLYFF